MEVVYRKTRYVRQMNKWSLENKLLLNEEEEAASTA